MKDYQKPRVSIEPHRVDTDGPAASMLMKAYGVELDEWQNLCLDAWLGKDEHGNYTAINCGLSLARQNGKSELILARCFYGMLVNAEKVLMTCHQQRSSKQVFMRLVSMFTNKQHPEICQQVKQIKYGIGEEGIFLNNGSMIQFTSRTRQTARGYAGLSLIVLDECQTASDDELAAIMATLSASPTQNRQLLYVGTPPTMEDNGEVFRRFRESCFAMKERGEISANCWHEWGVDADSLSDIDISDHELWLQANPALSSGRLSMEFTEQESRIMSPLDFARERLGYWQRIVTVNNQETAIAPELWDSCRSDEEKPEGKTAFGVKFSPDGSEVVLAGAVVPKSGPARITLLAIEPTGRGVSWLAEWLNERYRKASCVVIDGKNGTDLLIDKIRPTWIYKDSIIKPSAQTVITAANNLVNELNERTVTWYSQQEDLRESAITATKRGIGGGWGFGGTSSGAIEACSLALWGCRTSKRDPSRQMRIG